MLTYRLLSKIKSSDQSDVMKIKPFTVDTRSLEVVQSWHEDKKKQKALLGYTDRNFQWFSLSKILPNFRCLSSEAHGHLEGMKMTEQNKAKKNTKRCTQKTTARGAPAAFALRSVAMSCPHYVSGKAMKHSWRAARPGP